MNPNPAGRSSRGGASVHLALLAATLIFGVNYTVAKVTMEEIPPLALICFRVGVPVLVFHAARRMTAPGSRIRSTDVAWMILLSFLGVVFNQLFFLLGLHYSTPINTSVLMTTIPITTLLFAIVLGRERATRWKILGIAGAFAGAAYLVGASRFEMSGRTHLGNLLVFANSLSYGLFLVLARGVVQRYPAVTFLAWIFTFGAAVVLPVGIPSALRIDPASISVRAWVGAAYIVVFTTLIAHYLNSWSLRRAESSTVGVYVFLQPVIATACSVLFLGEVLRAGQIVAASLIFAGVYLAAFHRVPPRE
jgi:drug/metabolite transporter (DMT)-like permease